MYRLQVVQNRALRKIEGCDRYNRTGEMHFKFEIPKLKSYIKTLPQKLYASAKTSRNRYIKKLGSNLKVVDPRVSRPSHISSASTSHSFSARTTTHPRAVKVSSNRNRKTNSCKSSYLIRQEVSLHCNTSLICVMYLLMF